MFAKGNKTVRRQLNQNILKRLFTCFCVTLNVYNVDLRWQAYFGDEIVYVATNENFQIKDLFATMTKFNCHVIFEAENHKNYFNSRDCKALVNLFSNDLFRKFVIFLAGYRTDFSICLTKCMLVVQKNIFRTSCQHNQLL